MAEYRIQFYVKPLLKTWFPRGQRNAFKVYEYGTNGQPDTDVTAHFGPQVNQGSMHLSDYGNLATDVDVAWWDKKANVIWWPETSDLESAAMEIGMCLDVDGLLRHPEHLCDLQPFDYGKVKASN